MKYKCPQCEELIDNIICKIEGEGRIDTSGNSTIGYWDAIGYVCDFCEYETGDLNDFELS